MSIYSHIRKGMRVGEKIVVDNSPSILTGLGVAGLVTTAYLTGKASFRAADVIAAAQFRENVHGDHNPFTKKQKFKLVWKEFIPPVGVGAVSIGCIVSANYVGTRRAAALASAYAISEKAFEEYRDKVVEKIGENKEREVRDEVAQDRVNRTVPAEGLTLLIDSPLQWFHDQFSNQYFQSTMEQVRKAENDINAQILHSDHATVSDFYSRVRGDTDRTNRAHGLQDTSISSDMGWNTNKFMEITPHAVIWEKDGQTIPVISLEFTVVPFRDPWKFQ